MTYHCSLCGRTLHPDMIVVESARGLAHRVCPAPHTQRDPLTNTCDDCYQRVGIGPKAQLIHDYDPSGMAGGNDE